MHFDISAKPNFFGIFLAYYFPGILFSILLCSTFLYVFMFQIILINCFRVFYFLSTIKPPAFNKYNYSYLLWLYFTFFLFIDKLCFLYAMLSIAASFNLSLFGIVADLLAVLLVFLLVKWFNLHFFPLFYDSYPYSFNTLVLKLMDTANT